MTAVERLISQIYDAKKRALETARQGVDNQVPKCMAIAVLPDDVRKAVRTYIRLSPKLEAAKAVIEKAGYDPPAVACGVSSNRISVDYRERDKRKSRLYREIEARSDRLRNLINKAKVATMGLNPNQAKGIIQQLQADLETL